MTIHLLIRRAIRLILFIVPLALFGNIIYTLMANENQGLFSILELHPGWLLLALFFSLSPWLFSIMRLSIWNRFFDLKLRKRDIAEAILANEVAAITTPTAVGGGYAKIGILALRGVSPGLATSLVLIGTVEDYLFFPILIPVCWYFFPPGDIRLFEILGKYMPSATNLQDYLIIAAVVAFVAGAALIFTRVRHFFTRFFQLKWWHNKIFSLVVKAVLDFKTACVLISKGGKRFLLFNALLATLQSVLRYSIFTAIAFGLGFSPNLMEFFLLQWLVFMLLNVVPTPGAIGGAEMVFIYIFEGFIPAGSLVPAAGYWRFVATYLQLLVAALILMLFEKPEIHLHKKPLVIKNIPQQPADDLPVTVVDLPASVLPGTAQHNSEIKKVVKSVSLS